MAQMSPHVDFWRMSRSVMGSYRTEATEKQLLEFTNVFRKSMVETYGRGLLSFNFKHYGAGALVDGALVDGGPLFPVRGNQSDPVPSLRNDFRVAQWGGAVRVPEDRAHILVPVLAGQIQRCVPESVLRVDVGAEVTDVRLLVLAIFTVAEQAT